jgi:exocyst complex component 4
VDFENEPLPFESSHLSQALLITIPDNAPPSRLSRFLDSLSLKPNDPPHDVESSTQRRNSSLQSSGGMTTSASLLSLGGVSLANQNQSQRNPEADSFAYIETLLEALAVLGKLGSALDLVAQRLPNEVFALVEGTLAEVEDRAEFNRRASVLVSSAVPRTDGVLVFSSNEDILTGSTLEPTMAPTGGILDTSRLRLAGLESSAQHTDQEILKDFFWTVYSKLDAVSQGLRLIYEISNRIGSVSFLSTGPASKS